MNPPAPVTRIFFLPGMCEALLYPKSEVGWSAGAVAGEHGRNGPGENREVELERPIVDVLEIELHPVLELDLVAAVRLPDAGEPGLHAEPAPLPGRGEALDVPHRQRARSDQAHG